MADQNAKTKIRVAVIGASGYAGLELVRLLVRHPGCELAALTSLEYPGRPFSQIFPALAGLVDLPFSQDPAPEQIGAAADVVFTAVPHQTAMGMIPAFLAQGCKVVDLSADFRFRDISVYEQWYQEHTAPELNAEAVYGLPELHRDEVRRTRLVGNPGCYPTGVILGLAPLAQAGLLVADSVIADCKSGASGAGRQALLGISFCEVNDGFRAYKVLEHRHTPEMEQELSLLAGTPVSVTFTPHLVPMSRGILGTLYAGLTEPRSEEDLRELYAKFYQGHPFVRLHPRGSLPDTRDVRGANFCDLALRVDRGGRRVIVISAIDNLTKGAAGQAVQNFNLMMGLPETMGLETPPFLP
ncbi:MAG: N-acetyl-gamma-glutamyl-phosphate reductase [Desulfobacterales bacterium]|nr:N-acetyl-gamma-glutamyl-phosphate reductase [Pseudomonadota bacterium]MBU4355580.1 N-acetyl-gamma-glutamyl-phosphate reductase [Pseudomonadota bacterium]MCG2773666.1 N-acetyl-gamma-glutamyl-phosphate reductase [Desulfobacterales bacterium]